MGIKANFTKQDIDRIWNNFLTEVENSIISRFEYLGELVVIHAKNIPAYIGFTDQTGNLRSSIGYVIYHNGKAIRGKFESVMGGDKGVKEGKLVAETVASGFDNGYVLVVVAGMNYAIYVEAKGRDVLTTAEQMAEQETPKMIAELKANILNSLAL